MRFIKTQYNSYVRIPENDDHLEFMVDSELFGDDFVYDVVMVDSKGNVTYFSNQFAEEEVALAVLDELMVFITEEDDLIIDMDVVFELAMDRR